MGSEGSKILDCMHELHTPANAPEREVLQLYYKLKKEDNNVFSRFERIFNSFSKSPMYDDISLAVSLDSKSVIEFAYEWIYALSELKRNGRYDERDKYACEVCQKLQNRLGLFGEREYLLIDRLLVYMHRTNIQTATFVILYGLVEGYENYYDKESIGSLCSAMEVTSVEELKDMFRHVPMI